MDAELKELVKPKLTDYPEFLEFAQGVSQGKRRYRDQCVVDGEKHSGGYGVRSPAHTKELQILARDLINENMVGAEIGCHTGISTEVFAKACKKIYAVDSWATHTSPVKAEDIFDLRMKDYDNVVKMKGWSDEIDKQFEEECLDFVYIDAMHWYEPMTEDLTNWVPKVKAGGLIMGHDYYEELVNTLGDKRGEVTKAVKDFFGKEADKTYKDRSFIIKKNDF